MGTLMYSTHEYAQSGTLTMMLTVSGPGGSDSEARPGYVTVLAGHRLYLPVLSR